MDSEFPDPDEEFDLVHEDEYELLREIEGLEKGKPETSKKVEPSQEKSKEKEKLNNLTPVVNNELSTPTSDVYRALNTPTTSKHIGLNTPTTTKHIGLSTPTTSKHIDLNIPTTSKQLVDLSTPSTSKDIEYENFDIDSTKKRTYDELFGDITDIIDINGFDDFHEHREKKPRWDHPQDVIKAVLDAREKFHEFARGVSVKRKNNETKRDTISLRVPRWNFVAVTRPHDSQRIYVRMKNTEDSDLKTNGHSFSNLLSVPYSQLKAEAEEIVVQNVKRASREAVDPFTIDITRDDELWVDKYKPRSYVELLSDESVNRHLLHWIKLWDKIVFNRNYVPSKKKKVYSMFRNKKFADEKPQEEVDSKGFPIQRIVLLSGPPGLGKTTLAHLAAKHAGYNVVEINASDERSPDAFRQVLLASTQMKAVMGSDPRPNCLVLDEIDGAPAPSIELLLKFVQGKLVPKGKKVKVEKQSNTCHRPVICICNEPYTPSLRALRLAALIIPVPEVSPARLSDRLMEVSQKEHLRVNPDVLLKLAEISGCDIRSCLGALQYMGGAKIGANLSFALKDSRKGLFDSWKQILTIPVNRGGMLPIPERVRLVLKTVHRGESDKLVQGIFHNYPEICSEKLKYVSQSLQWFQFYDEISTMVATLQVWSVMPYTNYAFVAWHLYLAKTRNVRLSYPSVFYEMNQKHARSIGILTSVQRSSGRDWITLAVDIAPYLPDLLSPRLRTVSGHLHSAKEREDIARLVSVLIEFGLTFTQDKNPDGSYDYKLDPNIFEVGVFPECKPRRSLVYAVKQIIVQELEAERLRRAASFMRNSWDTKQKQNENKKDTATKSVESDSTAKTQNGTNNKPKSTADLSKKIEPEMKEVKYKDFFGRVITVNQDKQKSDKESTKSRDFLTKHGVWYKYKEGFSNAVRRNIIMKELL